MSEAPLSSNDDKTSRIDFTDEDIHETDAFLSDSEEGLGVQDESLARMDTKDRNFGYRALQLAFLISITIMVVLILPLYLIGHNQGNSPSIVDIGSPCGNEPKEARDNGCSFDPLTFGWTWPPCYDFNLTGEFLKEDTWQWYLDEDGSQALSLENLMQGQYRALYVSWDYHVQRCAYTWMKMHRSVLNRTPLDSLSSSWSHVVACESVLRSREAGNNTLVLLEVEYPSCKQY